MTIKAATKFAIVGVSVSIAMSIAGSYLFQWAFNLPGDNKGFVTLMDHIYYHIQALFNYGGLLVFFVTLNAKQKAKEQQ